jgi:hypothetical protein
MVTINDIPAEVRWEIATKAANSQSVFYDMFVRQIIGYRIDEIWNAIMTEGVRNQGRWRSPWGFLRAAP